MTGLVALGDTHQVVGINGTTVIAAPGAAPVALRGGILAWSTEVDPSVPRY